MIAFRTAFYLTLLQLSIGIACQHCGLAQEPGMHRRVLAEEQSGTWCQYCVESAGIMSGLHDNYNGDVIPVVIHAPSILDSLTIPAGDTIHALFTPPTGVPRLYFDRTTDSLSVRLGQPATVRVRIDHAFSTSSRELTATVEAVFVEAPEPGDIRINFYVVEDSVIGHGWGYDQSNGYNDTPGNPYFGKGRVIKGYAHRYVLRAALSNARGTGDVIPAEPVIGVPYRQLYRYILPAKIDARRAGLVAFISYNPNNWADSTDASVLNATDAPLIPQPSSAPAERRAENSVDIAPMPLNDFGAVRITLAAPGDLRAELWDCMGRVVATVADGTMAGGEQTFGIETAGLPGGAYTLVVRAGGSTIARRRLIVAH